MNTRTPGRWLAFIWKVVLPGIALSTAYILAGVLSTSLDFVQENERVLLPQSGIAVAGLVICGWRFWPFVMLASLYMSVSGGRAIPFALLLAAGNTLAPLLASVLITRHRRYQPGLLRLQDLYAFLIYGCLLAPVVNTVFAVAGIMVHSQQKIPIELLQTLAWKRWFGHGVSNLIMAPVLLAWVRRPELRYPPARIVETLLLIVALAWVLQTVFSVDSVIASLNYPVSFMPFPVMIWAALRYGPRGASTATFLLAAAAVYGTSSGYGPFVRQERAEGLVLLQVYLLSIALSSMFLGSAMAERREAVRSLSAREAELRSLSARLQHAREEERAYVAREIHDELGQQLTGLKMGIHALCRRLPIDSDLQSGGQRLVEQTDHAVGTVREIATRLRPGILDDLGILEALRWLVDDFESKSGIEAIMTSNTEELQLSPDLTIAIFRVAQEALTNVLRHAQACSVQISMLADKSGLTLTVADDGVGVADTETQTTSLGIVGMRERVALTGGVFSIRNADRGGTEIVAKFPMKSENVQ